MHITVPPKKCRAFDEGHSLIYGINPAQAALACPYQTRIDLIHGIIANHYDQVSAQYPGQ